MFGIAYAIGSLSCALPLFLAAVGGSFTRLGFWAGLACYLSYALGMGLFVTGAAVATALAGSGLLHRFRRAGRILPSVSGELLGQLLHRMRSRNARHGAVLQGPGQDGQLCRHRRCGQPPRCVRLRGEIRRHLPPAQRRRRAASGAYQVPGLPFTAVIGPDGTLLVRHPGAMTAEQLEYVLQSVREGGS